MKHTDEGGYHAIRTEHEYQLRTHAPTHHHVAELGFSAMAAAWAICREDRP